MTIETLRRHVESLKQNAESTRRRSAELPEDWLLAAIAENQHQAAVDASRTLAVEEAAGAACALEWKLVGQRLKNGEIPLSLLAKLAEPLNKLLLRAAYFARNKMEPQHGGVGDDLANELDLRLTGLAPGSTRLFVSGNVAPDTTGASAFGDAVDHLLDALLAAKDFRSFYERIADLGESAASSLRDTLKALEQEEASVQVIWRTAAGSRTWQGQYDEVVRLRTLLDGVSEPTFRQVELTGTVELLAANGRLRLVDDLGQRKTIRFNPKTQEAQVIKLHLAERVTLSVTERAVVDPIGGEEVSQYRLNPPPGQIG